MSKIDTSPEAVAKMLDHVTPGPWRASARQGIVAAETREICSTFAKANADEQRANARFIAWAREAVPALAAERDAALAREAKLREALVEARDAAHSLAHSEFDGVWSEQDFKDRTPLADAALQDAAK